jgi:site-specific recombinase
MDTHQSHHDRLAFLAKKIRLIQENLKTPNATIGRIIIDSFSDEKQLEDKLRRHIREAVNQRGIQEME